MVVTASALVQLLSDSVNTFIQNFRVSGPDLCNYSRNHFLSRYSNYQTRVRSLAMLVTNSLTNSLTDCCLVILIYVTLACEDGNSKLVEVVTVVDIDDEDRVGNSL